MPRSLLNSHAPLIHELLGKGATNQEILKALSDKSVKTSLEAVRVWVNKNAKSDLLKGRGKGRRKNPDHVRFDFLPDFREAMAIPQVLESALKLFSKTRITHDNSRGKVAEALLRTAGILVDSTFPPSAWTLPAKKLSAISDLELLFLAYLLSDRIDPPYRGTTAAYLSWLVDLMRDTAKMRAKIKRGKNFTFSEIT